MSNQQETTAVVNNKMRKVYELSNKKPVYIIAVPKYHERTYKHIEKNHDWLVQTKTMYSKENHGYGKKIISDKDRKKLQDLIFSLRTEKQELFVDENFHPKPSNQTILVYIEDFLKSKSIHTHYTFKDYYRVSVYPPEVRTPDDIDTYLDNTPKEQDAREEYLIIPLLIKMKRGKSFSNSKMVVGIDPQTGEAIVEDVNPKHFFREKLQGESDMGNEERQARMEFLTSDSSPSSSTPE